MPTTPRTRAKRTPPVQSATRATTTPKKSVQRATGLYTHVKHEHTPRNANTHHKEKIEAGGLFARLNMRVALAFSSMLGSMWCAYVFILLALYGFPGFHATPTQYTQWISQTFIQLVALSVLQVASNIIGSKMETLIEEIYKFIVKVYHDDEQLVRHMHAQDAELIAHGAMLRALCEKSGLVAPIASQDAPKATTGQRDTKGRFVKGKSAVPSDDDTVYDRVPDIA